MYCFKASPAPIRAARNLCLHLVQWLTSIVLVIAAGTPPAYAQADAARLEVVATFSILGDFARNVGGDQVDVSTLVGFDGDVHVYTPSASDAESIRKARLVIVNGLGLEGWLPRLVQSSGGRATIVIASDGIPPRTIGPGERHDRLRAVGSVDPHAWQSVMNAAHYVANIRDAMIAADPANTATYRDNAAVYLARLGVLDRDVRESIGQIPEDRRKVVSTHDAFGYFAEAYGVTFIAPQGVSTDSEPSARDIAAIVEQIKTGKTSAVFLENIADPRLMKQIASETGAKIGGTLYSDSLTGEHGEASTYIDLIRHNTRTIVSALAN
jgi:zinc/manganese transport system substrate-binding protein